MPFGLLGIGAGAAGGAAATGALGGFGGALAGASAPTLAATSSIAAPTLLSGFGAAGAALGGAQQLFGILGQEEQRRATRAGLRAQRAAAVRGLRGFDRQNLARQQEINERAALQKFQRERQGLRTRAGLRARSAETGILGNTPLRQLNAAAFETAFDVGITEANREARISQSLAERDAAAARARSQINLANAQLAGLQPINPFAAALQIGGGALSGGAAGERFSTLRRRFR
jgi:hypothetical protein